MKPSKIKIKAPNYLLLTDLLCDIFVLETAVVTGEVAMNVTFTGATLKYEKKTDSQRGELYHIFKSL